MGVRWKVGGVSRPTGPGLISKWGLVQFGPTQWWVWHTSYFSSRPLNFEYLAMLQVYTFFWWRLYYFIDCLQCSKDTKIFKEPVARVAVVPTFQWFLILFLIGSKNGAMCVATKDNLWTNREAYILQSFRGLTSHFVQRCSPVGTCIVSSFRSY